MAMASPWMTLMGLAPRYEGVLPPPRGRARPAAAGERIDRETRREPRPDGTAPACDARSQRRAAPRDAAGTLRAGRLGARGTTGTPRERYLSRRRKTTVLARSPPRRSLPAAARGSCSRRAGPAR